MKNTIEKHRLIEEGERIVVGLSGGPDSLAMTHALLNLKESMRIDVIAVHINHMFRGLSADEDETFVVEFCRENNVKCYTFRLCVEDIAKAEGMSFEEAGRKVRYEKFHEIMAQEKAHKIAVAQNKNDLIETFFINLFRGAGVEGLASIDYVRDGYVIRPLLDVDRCSIESYCHTHDLMPRIDHTNATNDYVRNRVRNELMPYVAEHFNENISESVYKTVNMMKEEKDYWKKHTLDLYGRFTEESNGRDENLRHVKLNLDVFHRCHSAEVNRLIRYCISRIKGNLKDVSYEDIKRIKELSRTSAVLELKDRVRVMKTYGSLVFYLDEDVQVITINGVQDESISGSKLVPSVPVLYYRCVPVEALKTFNLSHQCVAIDADVVKGPLKVRYRRDGDVFNPLGMQGRKKIKSFFIDEKVPKQKRDEIPLVCDEENIIWVYEMRISDLYKITEYTKNVMVMSFTELVE